jgi:hypothetical protein
VTYLYVKYEYAYLGDFDNSYDGGLVWAFESNTVEMSCCYCCCCCCCEQIVRLLNRYRVEKKQNMCLSVSLSSEWRNGIFVCSTAFFPPRASHSRFLLFPATHAHTDCSFSEHARIRKKTLCRTTMTDFRSKMAI